MLGELLSLEYILNSCKTQTKEGKPQKSQGGGKGRATKKYTFLQLEKKFRTKYVAPRLEGGGR